jgi:hypothetical protein
MKLLFIISKNGVQPAQLHPTGLALAYRSPAPHSHVQLNFS